MGARAARPGTPWFRFKLDRGRGPASWEVRLATESDSRIMVGNCGLCLTDQRLILIDPTVERHDGQTIDSTVWHELLHASWMRGDQPANDPEEERIVSALEKRLWPVLSANGLCWPAPKGGR